MATEPTPRRIIPTISNIKIPHTMKPLLILATAALALAPAWSAIAETGADIAIYKEVVRTTITTLAEDQYIPVRSSSTTTNTTANRYRIIDLTNGQEVYVEYYIKRDAHNNLVKYYSVGTNDAWGVTVVPHRLPKTFHWLASDTLSWDDTTDDAGAVTGRSWFQIGTATPLVITPSPAARQPTASQRQAGPSSKCRSRL